MIFCLNLIPTHVYCNQKIALFGDSLMSGYGLKKDFHLSTVLEKSLQEKGYDINVIKTDVTININKEIILFFIIPFVFYLI